MEKETKQQINKLAGSLVEFQDEFESMPKPDCQWVIQNTRKAIQLFIASVKNRKRDSELIAYLGSSILPATTEKFVVKKKFVVDKSEKAKVKISGLDSHFHNWFLYKIEKPKPETTLHRSRLLKSSVDSPIIAELGGKKVVRATLQEIYQKMEQQPNGEEGDLDIDGNTNIFYIPEDGSNPEETLRAVGVCWCDDGWLVKAFSVEYRAGGPTVARFSFVILRLRIFDP